MVVAFGEPIIISFDRTAADEKRLRRCRYLTWCFLFVSLLALLLAVPGALRIRLLAPELSSSKRGRGAASVVVPRPNASILSLRNKTQWAPVLAIIAGYDNCWDSISATNPTSINKVAYTAALRFLRAIQNIDTSRERTIIFVGSIRQSVDVDKRLANAYQNGVALGPDGAFEAWVAGNEHTNWELNRALLADGSEPFSAWRNSSKTFAWSREEDIKVRMVENTFRQLQDLGPVDVYFFDSSETDLDYVRNHTTIPPDISFHSVFYDAHSYGAGDGKRFRRIIGKDSSGQLWKLL